MASPFHEEPYSIRLQYLIPVPILAALSLGLCIPRIWTRVTRTRRMYIDDWLIAVAEVLSLANAGCAFNAFAWGWGKPAAQLTTRQTVHILKQLFAVETTWIITLCLVRVSVACSLLRFGRDLLWRGTLFFLIGLQILISCSYIVIQFGECTPVSANWESVPNVKCWPNQPIVNYGWAIAGVYVTMDLILALMPIRLVRTLSRPKSEKILIGVLMAAGLLATSMSCAKMTTFSSFGDGDPMQFTIKPSTYAKLEEQVGIIASCLPALKGPAEKMLRRFGVLDTRFHNTRPSFVDENQMSLPNRPKEQDQRSSGEASSHVGKDGIRIDSVGMVPGSSNSKMNEPGKGWETV